MTVCRLMHQVVFTPLVPFDDNRVAVAAGLRDEFRDFAGSLGPAEMAELTEPPCSVFEVLVGLAMQADAQQIPLTVPVWFNIFIENLGLDRYTDEHISGGGAFQVEKIINKFNNREYRPDGRGGIFPLKHPQNDQRTVQLWYQMGAYIIQEGMF